MKRALILLALMTPVASLGDDSSDVHPYLGGTYFASVGMFWPDQDTKFGLAGSIDLPEPGPDLYLDFDETFDFSTSDETIAAEIGWRFGEKWQLRGQYFRVDNSNRAVLEEDVEWGDYTFNAGTSVRAGSDMQVTRLFFGRTVGSEDTREFGFGIGGHVLDIAAFINGNATIDGVDAGFRQERASVSQPLPNVGVWFAQAFSPRLMMMARADWLSASFDKYDGHIFNGALSLGYALTEHWGISLAYNYFEIDLDIDDNDWQGRARARFNGPYFALTGYW